MINSTYAKAYKEVLEIIKYFPKEEYDKTLKYQRRVAQAVKRARQIALLPYVTDMMK